MLKMLNEKMVAQNLVGISVCRSDIKVNKNTKGIKIKFGDMHSLSFKNKTFNVVIARHCLEHSPMPLLVLYEIHRVLRSSGLLCVVLPANTPFWTIYDGHFSCMPKENWIHLFSIAGFKIEHEENGNWFAVATNKNETEWRFILRRLNEPQYEIPYKPI